MNWLKTRKLTLNEWLTYQQEAISIWRVEKEECHYRYGQALWNVLPKEVTQAIDGTSLDFFYWYDEHFDEINQICLDYLVDYSDQ